MAKTLGGGPEALIHTFLLEPGCWQAEGSFHDEHGEKVRATGEATITHAPKIWKNSGHMTIHGTEPATFESHYEIMPFSKDVDSTQWTSLNPAIGQLNGTYTFIDDTILSIFRSEDGEYQGQETLLQVSLDQYRAVGAFFKGNKKLSSWNVILKRINAGKFSSQ